MVFQSLALRATEMYWVMFMDWRFPVFLGQNVCSVPKKQLQL